MTIKITFLKIIITIIIIIIIIENLIIIIIIIIIIAIISSNSIRMHDLSITVIDNSNRTRNNSTVLRK